MVHRGETGEGDGREYRVAEACDLDFFWHGVAELTKAGDGAEGDDVRRADDRVDAGYGVEELLGAGKAGVDAEVADDGGTGSGLDARVADRLSGGPLTVTLWIGERAALPQAEAA